MDWIATAEFKSVFDAARSSTNDQVELAIQSAEDELIELVGQEAVTDTLSAVPTDADRATKIVRAHKFLAISLHLFNVRTVKREHDAGSPAISGGMIINEYYSPKELKELSDSYRAMALRAIGSYLITDVAGDEYSSAPEYNHPEIATSCSSIC
jgi:hypothetical protein